MKLACAIFKYYPYGGLQRDFLRFANYCASQGHEVHLFTMAWEGERPKDLLVDILPVTGFSNHTRALNFAELMASKRQNFDAIIGFDKMPGIDFYFAGDLCFVETAMQKHRSWYKLSPRFRKFAELEASVFQMPSQCQIFVMTESVKNSYQKIYDTDENRFTMVPAGIKKRQLTQTDLLGIKSRLRRKFSWDEEDFYCLQVGSDFKRKGVDRSIYAIAALPKALQQRTHLLIFGRGKNAYYLKLAKKLGVEEQVQFLGTSDKIDENLLAADLLLHPARFETAGMVLLEALTCGLPVLVTKNCGYAYHVANAEAGKLIDEPFKQQQFNQELCNCLDKSWLQKKSQKALKYAATQDLYSLYQVCLEEILKLRS